MHGWRTWGGRQRLHAWAGQPCANLAMGVACVRHTHLAWPWRVTSVVCFHDRVRPCTSVRSTPVQNTTLTSFNLKSMLISANVTHFPANNLHYQKLIFGDNLNLTLKLNILKSITQMKILFSTNLVQIS